MVSSSISFLARIASILVVQSLSYLYRLWRFSRFVLASNVVGIILETVCTNLFNLLTTLAHVKTDDSRMWLPSLQTCANLLSVKAFSRERSGTYPKCASNHHTQIDLKWLKRVFLLSPQTIRPHHLSFSTRHPSSKREFSPPPLRVWPNHQFPRRNAIHQGYSDGRIWGPHVLYPWWIERGT